MNTLKCIVETVIDILIRMGCNLEGIPYENDRR